MATCPSPKALLFMLRQAGFARAENPENRRPTHTSSMPAQARGVRGVEMNMTHAINSSKDPVSSLRGRNNWAGRCGSLLLVSHHRLGDGLITPGNVTIIGKLSRRFGSPRICGA